MIIDTYKRKAHQNDIQQKDYDIFAKVLLFKETDRLGKITGDCSVTVDVTVDRIKILNNKDSK